MIAEKIFQWRLTEHFKHRREPGTLYVTDLIYCPNRVVLEEQNPALAVSEVYNPTTITGSIVHTGLQTLLKEWFEAQPEVEGEMKIGETTIKGRIDALIGRTGVEIKTARSDTGIPQPHHIEQCIIYNTMFNLEKTILIYLTPDRITEYEVSKQYGEPEIVKLATSKQSPRYPWECQYCRYSILCSLKVVK
jgi:CRISPR-associated exonuclease Cas4